MHDIRSIRDDPEAYDRGWDSRGLPRETPAILEFDETLRAAQTALQAAQSRRNEASRAIGLAKAGKDGALAERLMAEVETLKASIAQYVRAETAAARDLNELLAGLPNLPAPEVPEGQDESCNVEVRRWGEPFSLPFARDHVDLGVALGLM
ncbi:MAG: serine--tRNA ligase, partial [Caulobacteraceae bacterium]